MRYPRRISAFRADFCRFRKKRLPNARNCAILNKLFYGQCVETYRSGHNGADSKFLEAPAVSSAENVHRTGLCAGSDFTISYRSCVFFLHSSGARITLEIYGELSERSKVRHSKSCFHFGSPNCRKASNHAGLRASSNCELGSVLSCCSSQFPPHEFFGNKAQVI